MADGHRPLASEALRTMLVLTVLLAAALLAVHRGTAVAGLAAGAAVGVADVVLLTRSIDRFGHRPATSARTLGTAMFSRFLSVGVLLGLVLCARSLDPVAAIVGFLVMPVSVAAVGTRDARRRRRGAEAAS
ncbi:MAG: ATP synthase subunit I [Candidatus Dormibacteria bacterium]